MNPYEIPPESREAYDEAGSLLLSIPKAAKKFNKKVGGELREFSSWSEYVQISDIEWLEPGVKTPSEPNDVTFALNFHLKVCPESQQAGASTKNPGKVVYQRLCFNIPAWLRDRKQGQGVMTDISFGNLKQLLRAFGISEDEGRSPKAFFEKYRDQLRGQKIWVEVSRGPDANDQDRMNVERFIKSKP